MLTGILMRAESQSAQERPPMSRKPARSPGGGKPLDLAFDPGPSVRRDKHGKLISRGPGAVILEDRIDEDGNANKKGDKPIIRGARRHSSLAELERRGTIDKRQHDAAIRFLDECSLAAGGGGTASMMSIRSASGPKAGLPEAQVAALARVRQGWRAVGQVASLAFYNVVFENGTLADYDALARRREGTAATLLKGALDRLADLKERWDNDRADRLETAT